MPPKGYRSTNLPDDLMNRIELVVKANVGYISVMDFIKEVVRMRLDEIEEKVVQLERIKKALENE